MMNRIYFGFFCLVVAFFVGMPASAEELTVQQVHENKKAKPVWGSLDGVQAQSPTPSYDDQSVAVKPAPADESYGEWSPDEESLRRAKVEELRSMKAKADREREEVEMRHKAYEKQAQYDEKMTRYQKHAQDYRDKEKQARDTIESMQREMAEIEAKQKEMQSQLESVEQRYVYEMKNHGSAMAQLNESKLKLQAAVSLLDRSRLSTERKINQAQVEMQKYRTEIMQSEASISRAKNDRVRLEAEEIRVRTELADLSEKNMRLQDDRNRMVAELSDQQQHLNSVKREYELARKDVNDMEREVRELSNKQTRENAFVLSEIKRLEDSTSLANNQRVRLEAEKVRIAAETSKLKESLATAIAANQQAVEASHDVEGLVMETRLSYETARADLSSVNAATAKTKLDADTRRIQARQMASLVESSDMLESQAPAEVVQKCRLRSQPSFQAAVVSDVKPGNRVIASTESSDDWVKVLNSSGSAQYIRKSCLKYVPGTY